MRIDCTVDIPQIAYRAAALKSTVISSKDLSTPALAALWHAKNVAYYIVARCDFVASAGVDECMLVYI